jgi:hypothetical protein
MYKCKEKLTKLFKTNESSVIVASSDKARQESYSGFAKIGDQSRVPVEMR